MGLLDKLLGRSGAQALPPPTYSNDSVIARIADEESVDRATARTWFDEMLIFLDLCARSDDVLSPPPNVDKAWHAFLLHTRDYEAYCTERFGRLIHHGPAGRPDESAYKRAYRERSAYGGSTGPDPMIWAVPIGTSGDDSWLEDEDGSGAGGDGREGSAHGGGGGFDSAGSSGGDSGGSSGGDSGGSSGGDSGGSSGGDSGGSSCGGSSCGGGSS